MGFFNGLRSLFSPTVVYYSQASESPHIIDLDTAAVYRTQPNLRAVVSFLADNVADIPLKCYDRRADNDRERLTDSTAALLLKRPNPYLTQFELMQTTASNMLLYGHCLWLVLEDMNTASGWSIYPVPPLWVLNTKSENAWYPNAFVIKSGSDVIEVPSSKCIFFRNYNPESPWQAVSPVSALKETLSEQIEANRYRLSVWKNGGRMSAYITRPKDVKPWTQEQAERFKKALRDHYSGDASTNGGGMPVLEDGMEIKANSFNAKEAQWAEAKKFSREEVASVYHINPALIWHDNSMTYASAKDNARALYAETLSPILTMLEQRMNASLLQMLGAGENEYVEFDIKKKLQGSFEEQAQVIQSSVGAPWLTRNEARAMQNLPAIDGGDELIVPLNVLQGNYQEMATGYNSAPAEVKSEPTVIEIKSEASADDIELFRAVLAKFFEHQKRVLENKVGKTDEWWDEERWNRELSSDLNPLINDQVKKQAAKVLKALGLPQGFFAFALCENYCTAMAKARAATINEKTKADIVKALANDLGLKEVFENAVNNRSQSSAASLVAHCENFASDETVRQAKSNGANYSNIKKTWHTHSANARPSHSACNGVTVDISDKYPNGLLFPGDISGSAEETCGCTCTSDLTITR